MSTQSGWWPGTESLRAVGALFTLRSPAVCFVLPWLVKSQSEDLKGLCSSSVDEGTSEKAPPCICCFSGVSYLKSNVIYFEV